MRSIRLPNRVINEAIEYLKLSHLYVDGMSLSKIIQTVLAQTIYKAPSLKEGRAEAAEVLRKTLPAPDHTVRGRVATFAQQYDWERLEGKAVIKTELEESIHEAVKDVEAELELKIPEQKIKKDVKATKKIFHPKEAPWKTINRISYDLLCEQYPKHKLLTSFALKSELHQIAVECAFAAIPASLRRSNKIFELAQTLFENFQTWIKIEQGNKKSLDN